MKRAAYLDSQRFAPLRLGDLLRGLVTLIALGAGGLLLLLLFPLRLAFLVTFTFMAGFVGYVLFETWMLRRRQARMAREAATRSMTELNRVVREIGYEQWMEGVNREAVRRGYTLERKTPQLEMFWRLRHADGCSPEQAVEDWENEETDPVSPDCSPWNVRTGDRMRA